MASPESAERRGNNAPPSPNTAKLRSSPKAVQASNRIDSILQGARERRIALGTGSPSGGSELSGDPLSATTTAATGMESSRSRENVGGAAEESSADEETSIVRRGVGQNLGYLGTATTGERTGTGERRGVRSKPSTSSIRRRGRVYEGPVVEGDEEEVEGGEGESWWARILSKYGSIELENKGSVARDHLALERTFLAWLRTSLAFASIGIAITQLFRLNTASASSSGVDSYKHLRQMGKPLGATFLGISIMMLGVGFHRYFESQHWIIRGKFPASRGSVMLVALVTFCLMITSLVVVVVVEPGAYEKR